MAAGSIDAPWRGFASDNYAGVHPEVLEVLAAVNVGHQSAYELLPGRPEALTVGVARRMDDRVAEGCIALLVPLSPYVRKDAETVPPPDTTEARF